MSITKHKQNKARKRTKRIQKEARTHRESSRSKVEPTTVGRPKSMSKEELLAQRVPIEVEK